MPRELRTELRTLLDTLKCVQHSTFDITLTDGSHLYLSTAEILVNRFGKNQQYIARIMNDVGELSLSIDVEADGLDFRIQNIDMVIGQLLTSNVRRLDGAEVIVGSLFLARGWAPANAIWDAKLPGSLIAGEISDESVNFSVTSVVDSAIVSGRTIANEFQWQEPVSFVPSGDPSDIPGSDNLGDIGDERTRTSRYGDYMSQYGPEGGYYHP